MFSLRFDRGAVAQFTILLKRGFWTVLYRKDVYDYVLPSTDLSVNNDPSDEFKHLGRIISQLVLAVVI